MCVRAYAWMGIEEVGIPSLRSGFRIKHLHDSGSSWVMPVCAMSGIPSESLQGGAAALLLELDSQPPRALPFLHSPCFSCGA